MDVENLNLIKFYLSCKINNFSKQQKNIYISRSHVKKSFNFLFILNVRSLKFKFTINIMLFITEYI